MLSLFRPQSCNLDRKYNFFPLCVNAVGLTDDEILAQAMIFIFAGYETSSSTMGFTAYNLATHPEIQKTLQQEVDKTFPEKVTWAFFQL